jgi:hypothetical protein
VCGLSKYKLLTVNLDLSTSNPFIRNDINLYLTGFNSDASGLNCKDADDETPGVAAIFNPVVG